jgi:hypothetical protein
MPKNKVNHLRKQSLCSQHAAPFFFGLYPLTPKENPLVSASSEALQQKRTKNIYHFLS